MRHQAPTHRSPRRRDVARGEVIPNTQVAHWVPVPAAVYRCVSAYLGDEVRLDGDVPELVPRAPSSADLHSRPRMLGPAGGQRGPQLAPAPRGGARTGAARASGTGNSTRQG